MLEEPIDAKDMEKTSDSCWTSSTSAGIDIGSELPGSAIRFPFTSDELGPSIPADDGGSLVVSAG